MTSASRPPLFCISAPLGLGHAPRGDLLPAVHIRQRSGPLGLAWTFQHVKGPAFLRKTGGFLHKRFIYYLFFIFQLPPEGCMDVWTECETCVCVCVMLLN